MLNCCWTTASTFCYRVTTSSSRIAKVPNPQGYKLWKLWRLAGTSEWSGINGTYNGARGCRSWDFTVCKNIEISWFSGECVGRLRAPPQRLMVTAHFCCTRAPVAAPTTHFELRNRSSLVKIDDFPLDLACQFSIELYKGFSGPRQARFRENFHTLLREVLFTLVPFRNTLFVCLFVEIFGVSALT